MGSDMLQYRNGHTNHLCLTHGHAFDIENYFLAKMSSSGIALSLWTTVSVAHQSAALRAPPHSVDVIWGTTTSHLTPNWLYITHCLGKLQRLIGGKVMSGQLIKVTCPT
ncbi:MAG: hypothetical protein [Bacteriophage sp.]|nr:MAG: hypothetical protein [Bacteriophage sp.]